MDDSIKGYQRFGRRTLVMLILGKSSPAILALLILIVLFAMPGLFPENYTMVSSIALPIVAFVCIFISLLVSAGGWLEYRNYAIFFDENNFKIRRGALNVEEIGVPYRHVKEVVVKRSIIDQLAGVSNVIISIVQDDDDRPVAKKEEIVLFSIDQAAAVQIQDAILRKTEIEKMDIVSK
ncbi:MAG: PH domain-containing protein [Candidatus Paceibacterota bacterium]|jgi:uncharacterized membrane protein YdbT with pleckstrin-like domain